MTFEQLEIFLAAAESRTFFDAAESLHISQSALSKQIMKLERELNLPLFDRSRRNAVLTEAGTVFLREARELWDRYLAMQSRLREFSLSSSALLRIGTLPVLSQYGITGILRRFSAARPDISLSLREVEEPELMAGLENGRYDLVIARSHMCHPDLHRFHLLAEDRLVVLFPSSHPLAARDSVSLNEIAEESFLLMPPYTALYQLSMQLFEDAGITPRILRTGRLESILSAVAFREGISLSAEKNFGLFRHESVTAVPLVPSPPLSVGVLWKKEERQAGQKKQAPKPALRCFLDFLRDTSI